MYMAYSQNPNLPRVRMEAVRLVEQGWSVREAARHFGYTHSAVVKWIARARMLPHNLHALPTRSSRPHTHARALPNKIVSRILGLRAERNQCAEILHYRLAAEGYCVSISSVKRTLKRFHCSRYSRWKKWHEYPARPLAENPGVLVEIDTIHDGPHEDRLYLYTMLDVCSRWAYAEASEQISTHRSLGFVRRAGDAIPFSIHTLQSDHGPEFSKYFTAQIGASGIAHRHSRVRKPNDNAHLERFNRTIQDECISRLPRKLSVYQKEIPEYLRYYNEERPHMGLQMKSPVDIINLP